VTTTAAILKGRLHPILPEIEAELTEIRERILIVRVYSHPLRALGGRVDGIQTDGDFTVEVATNCVQRQALPLAAFLVLGTVVVVPGAFRVWPVRLEGVGPAVDEEMEVMRYHTCGRLEAKIPHSLLLKIRWTTPLLYVVGEARRILDKLGSLATASSTLLSLLNPKSD
jgi:hypothetical protein